MAERSSWRDGPEPLLVRVGNVVFRYRNLAFPLLGVPMLAFFAPIYPWGSAAADRWLDLAVIALALAGEGLRAAVVGLAYIKRGGLNKKVHAERLVTEGLFAHSRNPLYVGNMLLILALLVIVNNPWVYLIAGSLFLFAYVSLVAAEEHYLRAKFGAAYEDYCRRVNRWLPNLRGIRATFRGMTFNWRRVILKEYSSVYMWIVAALVLETDETLRNMAGEAAYQYLGVLAALLAAASTLFLTVYYLKKSGRFTDPAG